MTSSTRAIILAICIFSAINFFAQPVGYGFGKQILIQNSQVSGTSDLTDFTVLISVTDPDLRRSTLGGHVETTNGFDIIFTEPDCITQLDHQIEKYDPVTGEYIAWVKIHSLPAIADYGIHMYYGNSAVSSDPSTVDAWKSRYEGIWHMNNNPSTSTLIDYSGNGLNGTSFGSMTSSDLVGGKIGDAIEFDGSNDYFALASKNYNLPNEIPRITISAWVNTTYNSTSAFRNWSILDFDRSEYFNIFIHADGRLGFSTNGGSVNDAYAGSTGDLNDGNWHHIVGVYTGTDKLFYINGSLALTETNPHGGASLGTGDTRFGFIGDGSEATSFNGSRNGIYYDGMYDEIRFTSDILSADWIQTEFNNQNSPASFYNISAEFTGSDLCAALPVELLYFSASPSNNQVKLDWQTATETDNDFYTIERSIYGVIWDEVKQIEGAGNSTSILNYSTQDTEPHIGVSYYRLKQTDYDGTSSYSQIESVEIDSFGNAQVKLYPNPFDNEITITANKNELTHIIIYNSLGQDVTSLTNITEKTASKMILDVSKLNAGIYHLKTKNTVNKLYKQ